MLKLFFAAPMLLLFGFLPQGTPGPGSANAVPADGASVVNPVKPTPESQARAKAVYGYDCAMCHGANGNGKGELVAELKLANMKDFSDPAALKGVSDGELFSIIKSGKGKMPSEGERATTEGLWNMVVLVRSFAKR